MAAGEWSFKTHKANPIHDQHVAQTLCGRNNKTIVDRWQDVTCHQCLRFGRAMDYREGIEND